MSGAEWVEWVLLVAGLAAVHLAWQTIAAGIAIVAMDVLPLRFAPRLRYMVELTLLLSLPILALFTAILVSSAGGGGLPSALGPDGMLVVSVSPLAAAAPWLGLAWLLGSIFGGGRLLRELALARRLRLGARPAGNAVAGKVRRQAAELGLRRDVAVLVSDDIELPCVVGPARPALLLPADFSTRLQGLELDSIITHELSHVRRRDLIAKAGQRAACALLFFHPVGPRILRRIDRNREICCDDLVMGIGMPARSYARALARLAVTCSDPPAATLGAGGCDVTLRVRRLMSARRSRPRRRHAALALALVAATVFTTIGLTISLMPATRRTARSAPAWETRVLATAADSFVVNATDPAGRFTLSVADGRAVGASIDGRRVGAERIRQRGARVTLPAGPAGGAFDVRLLPGERIEWSARDPAVGRR